MFVAGSRTRRASPHDGIAVIKRLNADIIFIPEFSNTSPVDESVTDALRALGYTLITYLYEQPECSSFVAAFLTRLPLRSHVLHSFTNTQRQFIETRITLGSGIFRVIGVHLDDRSEELRLAQVPELASLINQDNTIPTIVLGDFNAMPASALFSRIARLRFVSYIARNLPSEILRSTGARVAQMAVGTTIPTLLRTTKFHDLDLGQRATISAKQEGFEWLPSIRLAKIDWIFGSSQISTLQYRVLPDVGSDHRPVLAILDIPTV